MQIDEEMGKHTQLLKEIQDSPMDINAIVAKRRRDFTGDFFRHLTFVSETYDSLEDRDGNVGKLYFASVVELCWQQKHFVAYLMRNGGVAMW